MAFRKVSPWVKLFVAFHCLAIASWSIPRSPSDPAPTGNPAIAIQRWNDSHVRRSPIRFYLQSSGFWQYWDMFAPNPSNRDIYGTVEVRLRDGSSIDVEYPRIADLPIHEKFAKERYRKFYERAHLDRNSFLWPDFARRVALWAEPDPLNPVVHVSLTRNWLDTAPPGKPQPNQYNSFTFYRGAVRREP